MINLYRLFLEKALDYGEKEAIRYRGQSFSYREVDERIRQISAFLRNNHISKNRYVIVYMENSVEAVCTLMAAAASGLVAVPLSKKTPGKRLLDIYVFYGVDAVLCDGKTELPAVCRMLDVSKADAATEGTILDNDDFICIFTSSSTGNPKGCMLKHDGIYNSICGKIDVLKLTPKDVIMQSMNIGFVASLWQMFAPLLLGGTLCIATDQECTNPWLLFQAAKEQRVTVMAVVPGLLKLYCESAKGKRQKIELTELRILVTTGQMITSGLVREYYSMYHIPLVNAYGQSECSDDTFHYRIPEDFENDFVPIGKPVHNFKVTIDTEEGNAAGELWIAGIGVIEGYLEEELLTAEKFVTKDNERYFRTGDLVRENEDGNYVFLGRLDNMIKVSGNRVYPEEVENYLSGMPGIGETALLKSEKGAVESLVLVYSGRESMEEKIREELSQRFPPYMWPATYRYVEKMPHNLSGKVDRKALKEIFAKEHSAGVPVSQPRAEHRVENLLKIIKNYIELKSEVVLADGWEKRSLVENDIDSMLFMRLAIELESQVDGLFSDEQLRMNCYLDMEDLAEQALKLHKAI